MLFNESELKFSKCNDTYIRPYLFSCGHSLCTACIEPTEFEVPNQFKCITNANNNVCERIHSERWLPS